MQHTFFNTCSLGKALDIATLSTVAGGSRRDYNFAYNVGRGIRKAWINYTKPFKAQKVY